MADYFVVVDVRIDDPEPYKAYMAKARPIIEANGGKYLVRGGDFTVLEGDYYQPRRIVMLQFLSKENFENWYYSDEYQTARKIRLPAGDLTMVGVEGFEG